VESAAMAKTPPMTWEWEWEDELVTGKDEKYTGF
jgi:hypothetical protein